MATGFSLCVFKGNINECLVDWSMFAEFVSEELDAYSNVYSTVECIVMPAILSYFKKENALVSASFSIVLDVSCGNHYAGSLWRFHASLPHR